MVVLTCIAIVRVKSPPPLFKSVAVRRRGGATIRVVCTPTFFKFSVFTALTSPTPLSNLWRRPWLDDTNALSKWGATILLTEHTVQEMHNAVGTPTPKSSIGDSAQLFGSLTSIILANKDMSDFNTNVKGRK